MKIQFYSTCDREDLLSEIETDAVPQMNWTIDIGGNIYIIMRIRFLVIEKTAKIYVEKL